MIIDVNQTVSKKKNQFEIIYNGEKKYVANLPFKEINGKLATYFFSPL